VASTGDVFVGTGENVDRAGLTAWTNPGNIISDNTTDATCNATGSDYLVGRNCGFSVPGTATIVGVTVRVEASEHSGGTEVLSVQLQDDTAALVGTLRQDTLSGTIKIVYVFGSTSTTWGATLTPAIVNHANFGARLWFETAHDVRIDFVTIAIEYTTGSLTQSISGSSTSTGGIQKQTITLKAGTSSNEGIVQKLASRSLDGTSTNVGILQKLTGRLFTGDSINSSTLDAAIVLIKTQFISGLSTSQGALTSLANKLLSGVSTNTGLLQKVTSRVFTGTSTNTGTVRKLLARALNGISTSIGNLIKRMSLNVAGASTSTGSFAGELTIPPAPSSGSNVTQVGYWHRRRMR
jgi:hypothetical protein